MVAWRGRVGGRGGRWSARHRWATRREAASRGGEGLSYRTAYTVGASSPLIFSFIPIGGRETVARSTLTEEVTPSGGRARSARSSRPFFASTTIS